MISDDHSDGGISWARACGETGRELAEVRERCERAESRVKELELLVGEGDSIRTDLRSANSELRARIVELESEREPKPNSVLVSECNKLAREFYLIQGYQAPDGFLFYESTHPHEQLCWRLAVMVYESLVATEIDDVLQQLSDEVEGGE